MKSRIWLSTVLCLSIALVARAEDIIIETRTDGINYDRYQELEGNWLDSQTPPVTAKSSAPGLPNPELGSRAYMFVIRDEGVRPASVRFYPRVSAAGKFFVYVTWPRAANATPVNYIIKHADGEDKKALSQNGWGIPPPSNANTWIPLGEYNLAPGDDHYVEVRVDADCRPVDGKNMPRVYADAMRFSTTAVERSTPASAVPVSPSGPLLPDPTPFGGGAPTAPAAASAPPVSWISDIREGERLGKEQNKKILIFFFSPDSAGSRHYDTTVFEDGAVRQALARDYVCVRLNHEQNADLAYRLTAFKSGTILLYNSAGQAFDKVTERETPQAFLARLNR